MQYGGHGPVNGSAQGLDAAGMQPVPQRSPSVWGSVDSAGASPGVHPGHLLAMSQYTASLNARGARAGARPPTAGPAAAAAQARLALASQYGLGSMEGMPEPMCELDVHGSLQHILATPLTCFKQCLQECCKVADPCSTRQSSNGLHVSSGETLR